MDRNTETVVSIQEVKDYLGIDIEDSMIISNISRLIKLADSFLTGAIGEGYPRQDARSKELALIIISELYEKRGTIETIQGNERKLIDTLIWQLKLEMRRNDESI